MDPVPIYPGTSRQQALLRVVVSAYATDPRVRAVVLFGSLARGTWDRYSDLDLDVVVTDDARLDVLAELHRLANAFLALGERALLIEPDGDDAGDVVLASFLGLSIRYHPLPATSPNIVDSLRVLAGPLDAATIAAAGRANWSAARQLPGYVLDRFLRLAVNAEIALRRQQRWRALQLVQLMREVLLEVFAATHGGQRPYHTFQALADPVLQARLGATVSPADLPALATALVALLDLLGRDLGTIGNDTLRLTANHREVLALLRARLAGLGGDV